jgi:hypothetical protein
MVRRPSVLVRSSVNRLVTLMLLLGNRIDCLGTGMLHSRLVLLPLGLLCRSADT